MKLQDSLYNISSENISENGHEFIIKLNPEHFIYQAHFPGEPITPGVCIMQIAVELIEYKLGKPLALKTVKNIKFLQIISPNEGCVIKYTIDKITEEDKNIKAQVTVSKENNALAKLSLILSNLKKNG